MKDYRQAKTAAELMEILNSDPEYVARREKREREEALDDIKSRQEQAVLLAELAAVGWPVNCVWDFVNMRSPYYPEAFPILLKHMQYDYSPRIREGIVRAMTVAPARAHWSYFVGSFKTEQCKDVKGALANLLSLTMDRSRIDEVLELINDSSHGTSRGFFLSRLARFKHPAILSVLEKLTECPAPVGPEAQRAVKAHKNRYYRKER